MGQSTIIIAKIQERRKAYRCEGRAWNKRIAAMTLDLSQNTRQIKLRATSALAMAMFEQTGLKELVDSHFEIDVRQKLTPGNGIKAFIGDMMGFEGRRAVSNVLNSFVSGPNDRLFGKKVTFESLGGRVLGRNLDSLFEKDPPSLFYDCYRKITEHYGLDSKIFNVDSTNFGINALRKESDSPDAAVPERCGHAKDGHHERLVYSLLSVTDGNKVVCYERPYDGSTADSVMDRGAVEFLAGKIDPKESVITADCKIATDPLIDLMYSKGFGFVAKCPRSFGKKIRDDIMYSVSVGSMDPSAVRDGWGIYDTDVHVNGKRLRFVAYRTSEDIRAGVEYHRTQGKKEAEVLIKRFESKLYNCDVDAKRDLDEILPLLEDCAFKVKWSIDPVEIPIGYGHRGRPRKDEKPRMKTEYRVNILLEFDEEKAKELSKDRGVSVLVTNLPRTNRDADNIRYGATADTVLLTYLNQYHVEHASDWRRTVWACPPCTSRNLPGRMP